MSVGYRAVQWSPYKRRYDAVMTAAIVAFLLVFIAAGKIALRGPHALSDEILAIRALATCAFLLLSLTLCIGPLARLDRRFLPLLHNRRHLGVTTFLVAAAHGLLATGYYHGFGCVFPLVSLLESNTQFRSISAFPFEVLGLIALLILFLMAGTSHDFWLKNLSPRVWKSLHMLVYAAWALVVIHIALGALQSERNPVYLGGLLMDVGVVCGLHISSAWKGRAGGHRRDEWIDVCPADELGDGRGRVVRIAGAESIAVFRHGNGVSAISNLCAHQGGPLGEGRIIDGCITCPWHGYQYRPRDGCAPAPFTEKLPTYAIKVEKGRVLVRTEPLAAGTPVEPAHV